MSLAKEPLPSQQPKRRRSRQTNSDDDEDDSATEGYNIRPSQKRKSIPSSQRMNTEESDQDIKKYAANLIRFALYQTTSRKPITRADIMEKVLAGVKKQPFNDILNHARELLTDIFGYTLLELPRVEKLSLRASQVNGIGGDASTQKYALINNIPSHSHLFMSNSAMDLMKIGFLCHLISLIKAAEPASLMEVDLVKYLVNKKTAITKQDTNDQGILLSDPYLGNVSELLREFHRQQYIVIDKDSSADGGIFSYRLGSRAKGEFKNIPEMMDKLYRLSSLPSTGDRVDAFDNDE